MKHFKWCQIPPVQQLKAMSSRYGTNRN